MICLQIWSRVLFIGEDRSGVVSGDTVLFLFLFLEVFPKLPCASSNALAVALLGSLPCTRGSQLDAAAVISLKICLDVPLFFLGFKQDLGVKKRTNVLGVTVGCFLGLPVPRILLEIGESGNGWGFVSGVNLLSFRISVCKERSEAISIIGSKNISL